MSLLDATFPADGIPPNKATARSHNAIINARFDQEPSVKDFGALGDGSGAQVGATWIPSRYANITAARTATGISDLATTDTVDWAALQIALNVGVGVYVPTGNYLINRTLFAKNMRIIGTKGQGWRTPARSQIETTAGFGPRPMLLFADWWFNWAYTIAGAGDPAGGQFYLADICFSQTDPNGMVAQFPGVISTSKMERCWIGSYGRGVALSGSYETSIENCYIAGFLDYGTRETNWASSDWQNGVGLYAHNHCTVSCCTFAKMGVGISVQGNAILVSGCRAEENVLGYEIGQINGGVPYTNADAAYNPFIGYGLYRSSIIACSAEANKYGWRINLGRAVGMRDVEVHGSTNRPGQRGQGGTGFEIHGIHDSSASIENLSTFGGFEDAAIKYVGTATPMGAHSRVRITQENSSRPGWAGTGMLISKNPYGDPNYHLECIPLNPTAQTGSNTNGLTTAFSDLALRGITGLRYQGPHIQANNLGGLVAATISPTNVAVVFGGASNRHDPQYMGNETGVPSSTLTPGVYMYAITALRRDGETSLEALDTTPVYKTLTVTTGQMVRANVFTGPGMQIRMYRGTVVNMFDGYFNAPTHATGSIVSVDDRGQAFDGRDMPPLAGSGLPSQNEVNTNYCVVLTPSWGTTCWVTAKATDGFTINYGTAPPDGNQTVQWLLFRP